MHVHVRVILFLLLVWITVVVVLHCSDTTIVTIILFLYTCNTTSISVSPNGMFPTFVTRYSYFCLVVFVNVATSISCCCKVRKKRVRSKFVTTLSLSRFPSYSLLFTTFCIVSNNRITSLFIHSKWFTPYKIFKMHLTYTLHALYKVVN